MDGYQCSMLDINEQWYHCSYPHYTIIIVVIVTVILFGKLFVYHYLFLFLCDCHYWYGYRSQYYELGLMARKVSDWSAPFTMLVGAGAVFSDFAIQASCSMHVSVLAGVTFRPCCRLRMAQEEFQRRQAFSLPEAGWSAQHSAPPRSWLGDSWCAGSRNGVCQCVVSL